MGPRNKQVSFVTLPVKMTSSDGLDLSNWMANLRDTIRDVPLVYMAIPGSHDSMINAVIPGKTAPDGPEWLGKISELFPGKVSGWVITQTLDVSQQLNAGIRYFDLRIGCFEGGFRFLHGLYSPYQVQELSKVNDFLNKHPKEVVVLDLQHVYNCTEAQKMELAGILKTIFGRKICNRVELPLNLCTLNNMAQKAFQVIVIFRDFEGESSFWSGSWPTPWPQKTKTSDLKNYLETYIQTRQLEEGYVTQCVLTPDFNFIMEK